jgi:hypothetical protein
VSCLGRASPLAGAAQLFICLAACGPGNPREAPPAAEEWAVGDWFLGEYGDEYWDAEGVHWVKVVGDGTWFYGLRTCSPAAGLLGGTWREVEAGVIEFVAEDDDGFLPFGSSLGVKALLTWDEACGSAMITYLDQDGDAFSAPLLVSFGTACLDSCDASGHTVVPCPGEDYPCP